MSKVEFHNPDRARTQLVADAVHGSKHPFTVFLPVGRFIPETVLIGRTRDIIVELYGIETGNPKTIAEVAAEQHISERWIRRLKARAMSKLREPQVLAEIEGENFFGGAY